jgi:hypothetical protein
MKRLLRIFSVALFCASLFVNQARAEESIVTKRVQFARGSSSSTLKGALKGDEIHDYVLSAKAGQSMHVTLKTSSTSAYFNVLPPGSEAALFIGSTSGNKWNGTLPVDGEYRVRVYLMRSAARRNAKATYTLSIGITGSVDAKVPGTPYHATGTVPCSVGTDAKGSVQCSFGVIRGGLGRAEVYLASPGFDVTLHKDKLRVLKFAGDTVTSLDPKDRVTSEKQDDNWAISVNEFYFYVIPEAVISGG